MNWHYASINQNACCSGHIRYETLLTNPYATSQSLADSLQLSARSDSQSVFSTPSNVARNTDCGMKITEQRCETDTRFDRTLYDQKTYLNRFDQSDLEFVLNALDTDLAIRLGYQDDIETARCLLT